MEEFLWLEQEFGGGVVMSNSLLNYGEQPTLPLNPRGNAEVWPKPTVQHGFFYNNSRFRSGYTNDSYLIGSWIGRQGQGAEAWAIFWLDARNNIQVNFRHLTIVAGHTEVGERSTVRCELLADCR